MTWGRLVAAVGMLLATVALALLAWQWGGLRDVRETVAAAGLWSPVLFVLLQALVTITPLPRTVFTVAAGVLFGAGWGLVLTVFATTVAAVAAYGLVRWLGAPLVARHADRRQVRRLRARLDRSGLLAMVSLRLIPVVPFAVLNYVSGLAQVRLLPFVVGTVVGVLPGTVAIVVLGDAVTSGHVHPALFAVSVAGGLLGLAGTTIAARRGPVPLPAGPGSAKPPSRP